MQVMVGFVHLQGEPGRGIKGLPTHRRNHRIHIGGARLLDRLLPHVHADISGFHRVVGDHGIGVGHVVGLGPGAILGDELGVLGIFDRHEVVPCRQVAHQRLGIDTAQLLFTHRERHHRHIGGGQAGVAQLAVERHVGVTIDGGHHRGLATRREGLDVGDDGLVIGMAEGRVFLHDVRIRHPLAVEEGPQDLVGGARIDVVRSEQHEALSAAAFVAHQVLDRRNGLLVGGRAGVEHVLFQFFTFVLHRIEQQTVQLREDRQHRLAAHRSPATEHD